MTDMNELHSASERLMDLISEVLGVSRESLLMQPPVLAELASDILSGAQSDNFLEGRVACTLGWRVAFDEDGNPKGFYIPEDPSIIWEDTPGWCHEKEAARTLSLPGWSSSEIREGSQWRVSLWNGPQTSTPDLSVISDSLPRAIVAAWILARISE